MIQRLKKLLGPFHALIVVALPPLAGALAAPAAPAAPPPPHSIRHEVLPNGLEILLLPEPQRDVASIQLWYRVGLPEEDGETAGYAHLLEHLMFTGTETVPDYTSAIRSLGGVTRSGPRRDLTFFANDVPRTAVEAVIALEADRMRGLILAPEAIARELEEIKIEEARTLVLSRSEAVADQMWGVAYAGHPYGRPFTGIVPAATAEQSRAFYNRFYGPDRACLVVAGGFESDPVLRSIQEYFGPLKPTGNSRPSPPGRPVPASKEPNDGVDPAAPIWIGLGYPVPGEDSPEAASIMLLDSYLNVEAADSLAAALRQGELAPASRVASYLDYLEGAGLLTVVATLNPGADAKQALDLFARAVARLTQARIDPDDLATLRDRRRLGHALRGASVSQRASELAHGYLHGCGLSAQARADSSMSAVQPADLSRTAATYLNPEQAVALRVGPPSRASRIAGSGDTEPPPAESPEGGIKLPGNDGLE